MIQREEELLEKIKVISLQPNQRTSKYSEAKDVKEKLNEIKERNEELITQNELLKQKNDHLNLQTNKSNFKDVKSTKFEEDIKVLKSKLKKETVLKSKYYQENKILKKDVKFNEVKRHDCNFHPINTFVKKNEQDFLEFKKKFFE